MYSTMHFSAKLFLSSALYQKGFVKSFIRVSFCTFENNISAPMNWNSNYSARHLPPSSSLSGYSKEQNSSHTDFVEYDSA